MLKHSSGRIDQCYTVRGVKAGHVVGRVATTDFPSPRAEHASANAGVFETQPGGIALEDATPGQSSGFYFIMLDDGVVIENPAWAWRPGSIFLGLDGELTQAEHSSGWSDRIGIATSPTAMRIDCLQVDRDYPEGARPSAAASSFPQF